jgi:hypothetical protein
MLAVRHGYLEGIATPFIQCYMKGDLSTWWLHRGRYTGVRGLAARVVILVMMLQIVVCEQLDRKTIEDVDQSRAAWVNGPVESCGKRHQRREL